MLFIHCSSASVVGLVLFEDEIKGANNVVKVRASWSLARLFHRYANLEWKCRRIGRERPAHRGLLVSLLLGLYTCEEQVLQPQIFIANQYISAQKYLAWHRFLCQTITPTCRAKYHREMSAELATDGRKKMWCSKWFRDRCHYWISCENCSM